MNVSPASGSACTFQEATQPIEETRPEPEETIQPEGSRPEWQRVKLKKVEAPEEEDAITSLIMTRPDRIPTTELPDFTKKPEKPGVGERTEEEAPAEQVPEEETPKKKSKKPKRPKKRHTEGEISETPTEDVNKAEPKRPEATTEESPEEKSEVVEPVSDQKTTDEVCNEYVVSQCQRVLITNLKQINKINKRINFPKRGACLGPYNRYDL